MSTGLARKGFDLDLKDGLKAESDLANILMDRGGKVEVKRDFKARETGNVFVELLHRGKPSGLSTTESEWWAVWVDEFHVFIVATAILKRKVHDHAKENGFRPVYGGDDNLSQGVLLPVSKLTGR